MRENIMTTADNVTANQSQNLASEDMRKPDSSMAAPTVKIGIDTPKPEYMNTLKLLSFNLIADFTYVLALEIRDFFAEYVFVVKFVTALLLACYGLKLRNFHGILAEFSRKTHGIIRPTPIVFPH